MSDFVVEYERGHRHPVDKIRPEPTHTEVRSSTQAERGVQTVEGPCHPILSVQEKILLSSSTTTTTTKNFRRESERMVVRQVEGNWFRTVYRFGL